MHSSFLVQIPLILISDYAQTVQLFAPSPVQVKQLEWQETHVF
jgi:hypothetical protein